MDIESNTFLIDIKHDLHELVFLTRVELDRCIHEYV